MPSILILVEAEFQDLEVMYPYYRFKEAGYTVVTAGSSAKSYKGKFGYPIQVDRNIEDCNPHDFDAVLIPGGWAPDFMRRNEHMIHFVKDMNEQGKLIASICHGGWMLASAHACSGKRATCFHAIKDDIINAGAHYVDEEVVIDQNLITSRKPDDLPAFCKAIMEKLNS